MKLLEIINKSNSRVFYFANTRDDGFVLDLLKIHINKKNKILSIEIRDLNLGICVFSQNGKLLHCEAWETEEEVQGISNLSKYYTAITGSGSRDTKYAEAICRNIDTRIEDKYLRFILKNFIFSKKIMEFDESLYEIWIPSKVSHILVNNDNPLNQKDSEVQPDTNKNKENFKVSKKTVKLKLISLVILVSVILIIFVSIQRIKVSYSESKWKNPSNWPQPTQENLAIISSATAPNNYINRKRDYEKILSSNILPSLEMIEKSFEDCLREGSGKWKETASNSKHKITYSSDKDFLDQIYKLDKEDQVLIFHNEFIRKNNLSNFEKSKLLGRLYKENLTRLLYFYSDDKSVRLSDLLEAQSNKDSLLKYLFYLVNEYQNTEISIECLLILENIFAIQERTVK